MVAEFEQQVVGVACRRRGECSWSFPSATGIDTVKKLRDGSHQPQGGRLPEQGDQHAEHRRALDAFLSAQSVYVDSSDTLWVLDVGNLGSGTPPHLRRSQAVAIDLTTNAVKRTIVSRTV